MKFGKENKLKPQHLQGLVEKDQQRGISQNLLEKSFEVYVNVACNDIVLTTLTKQNLMTQTAAKTTISMNPFLDDIIKSAFGSGTF